MLLSHKIALDLNDKQATYMAKAAGCARFAYNWALAEWGRQYEAWKADNSLPKPTAFSLCKLLNSIKREQFPWMLEVTSRAPERAIYQLGDAFSNFFAKRSKYPKFKKKGVHDSFYINNYMFSLDGSRIRIPKLGWVRMAESLRFQGKIMSATVSRRADKWYVSINVDIHDSTFTKTESQSAVGVDLGVSALATMSTGEVVIGPKPHKVLLKRLRRVSRSLSRKVKGSQNWRKAKAKLARLHARISNIRNDALHKLTTSLTKRFGVIGIEDLNVRGMVRNRHLSRSISDMAFGEFRRQLEYKALMRGVKVVVADRFFPSSKTCSACGYKLDKLSLSKRSWACPSCGVEHNRDVNAAINLKDFAVSSTVLACGEESAGRIRKGLAKLASMKQEVSFVPVLAGMS